MAEELETTSGSKRPPSAIETDECPSLKVVKLSDNATLPQRASEGAAGYDLFAAEETSIAPATRKVVKTDIAIAVPPRHYGRIAPRSGTSFKFGIDIAAGVIDSDYRGPVGMLLVNNGVKDFEVKVGDRVAQLLLERVSVPAVEEVDTLENTKRGDKGFGSTGTGALANQLPKLPAPKPFKPAALNPPSAAPPSKKRAAASDDEPVDEPANKKKKHKHDE